MKEELIRVLKAKLDDINSNIDSLVEVNKKIDSEKEKLEYAKKILDIFKSGDDYDIYQFVNLKKDDFNNALDIVKDKARDLFSTERCNYDGLVYLINGINSGVSLSLTEEQKNGIEYLIRGLNSKVTDYEAVIDGLLLVKTRFEIDDIEVLTEKKNEYVNIIGKFDTKDYVNETNKVLEAMDYSNLGSGEKVDLLSYLLEYNADVYENKGTVVKNESIVREIKDETNQEVEMPKVDDDIKFAFKPFEMQDINESNEVEIPNDVDKEEPVYEETKEELPDYANVENEITFEEPNYDVADNVENTNDVVEEVSVSETSDTETLDNASKDFEEFGISEETNEDLYIEPKEESTLADNTIDQDFSGVVTSEEDYEENKVEETTSTRELQRLFGEYGLTNIEINERLLAGNVSNYRNVIESLKRNDLLDRFASNKELMQEVLTSSGEEEIEEVLKIIKEQLSIDDNDYKVTVKNVVDTLPTVFIKDGGNYDNFVKNVKTFKNLGIDLINLYGFSKEVFIVDNDFVLNNYNIVSKYNVEIDYKNAKYMLMLPNIAEKIDYYVESVYEDKTKKNEKFDGITYINNYAVKLNNVCDLTIKRLRYASENGYKVFGSKPNSLTGEITNLKVNALEISDEYLNQFFNNEFDGLTSLEVREYTKLIRNSSNVGNYSDELEMLAKYQSGLRYIIEGINISYNKVVRIYNVLRSYGINNNKALHFALCYNLVITKEEYQKLKKIIEELGGNA